MATEEEWENHGYEIYRTVTTTERQAMGKPPLERSTSFTSGAIKKASVQWYKMKWFYTGKATNTWGDELQGYAVVRDTSPLDFAGLDILRPGKVNQVRLRFFNLCRGDDASDDFRCAFLKVRVLFDKTT
ncbi:uncharacterized protein LOC128237746 [Mya arenaria]|uniref:uncharacterized protein LOC128237746 n=1 Tax=Mya arenaria TaxID=6604 RepID=UPI0022E4DA6B|nr:uncharacterized protein LOC128237746 [Mya arenaria]